MDLTDFGSDLTDPGSTEEMPDDDGMDLTDFGSDLTDPGSTEEMPDDDGIDLTDFGSDLTDPGSTEEMPDDDGIDLTDFGSDLTDLSTTEESKEDDDAGIDLRFGSDLTDLSTTEESKEDDEAGIDLSFGSDLTDLSTTEESKEDDEADIDLSFGSDLTDLDEANIPQQKLDDDLLDKESQEETIEEITEEDEEESEVLEVKTEDVPAEKEEVPTEKEEAPVKDKIDTELSEEPKVSDEEKQMLDAISEMQEEVGTILTEEQVEVSKPHSAASKEVPIATSATKIVPHSESAREEIPDEVLNAFKDSEEKTGLIPKVVALEATDKDHKLLINYYKQMKAQKPYSWKVQFFKAQGMISKENESFTLVPNISNCTVYPNSVTIDSSPENNKAEFIITPITTGPIQAHWDIYKQGEVIDKVYFKTKASRQNYTEFCFWITILVYIFPMVAQKWCENPYNPFVEYILNFMQMYDVQQMSHITAGVFIAMAFISFLIHKAKKAKQMEHSISSESKA
jgi:hypothetical protein